MIIKEIAFICFISNKHTKSAQKNKIHADKQHFNVDCFGVNNFEP